MNRKALFTGGMFLLVMFAILPAANAVVLDPMECPSGNSTAVKNIYAQYNLTYQTCGGGLIETPITKKYNVSYSGIFNVLKNKPDSKLTWGEAYFLTQTYSLLDNFTPEDYHKTLHYANLMIQKENTPQSRALAYEDMSFAADSMNTITGNPSWLQKEVYFDLKFMENDPDGIVNTGWSNWENSSELNEISTPMKLLQEAGYTVSPVAISFPWRLSAAANDGKIHTMEDLNKLGFEQWKQNYITPLINEKAPLPRRIAENIPVIKNNPDLVGFISYHGMIVLLISIFILFVIGIVGVVVIEARRK